MHELPPIDVYYIKNMFRVPNIPDKRVYNVMKMSVEFRDLAVLLYYEAPHTERLQHSLVSILNAYESTIDAIMAEIKKEKK